MSTSQNHFLYSFLNQYTFPYLQSSDNSLHCSFDLKMFCQKISHQQLPWGPDSTLEGGWFWIHLDGRAEVCLSWEQSCPLNTWLLFALVTFPKFSSSWPWKTSGIYLPCSGNSTHAVENLALFQGKEPIRGSVVGQEGYPRAGISPVISHMTSGHVFSFELPLTTVSCKAVLHEELGSALLSWWCGLNKPRRLCQRFKARFLLRMK